jgi:uncharacterized protein (TIGR02246 family)
MTRHARPLPLLIALVLAAVLPLAGCGPSEEEMLKAARQVDADFIKAMKKEDVDAVMAIYWNDPKVVMLPTGDMIAKGPDAIRAGYKAFFEGTNVKEFKMTKQEYRVLGDAVLGWGLFTLTTVPSLGPEVTIEGRYTEIIAERDDKWVYVFDHASVPLSPNAPAEPHVETIQPGLPPPSE